MAKKKQSKRNTSSHKKPKVPKVKPNGNMPPKDAGMDMLKDFVGGMAGGMPRMGGMPNMGGGMPNMGQPGKAGGMPKAGGPGTHAPVKASGKSVGRMADGRMIHLTGPKKGQMVT